MLLVNNKKGITCEILADLAKSKDREGLRTLSEKFRRWAHQLRIFEDCQAAGSPATIYFEPLLQDWFNQTGKKSVSSMRRVLRDWDRQLRKEFDLKIGERYRLFLHDSAPCAPLLAWN
jgi:hypothetical protein